MVDHDCGEIPVVESLDTNVPVGVVTDRDIVCRTVAKGLNPLEQQVSSCMSTPLISVKPDDSLDRCYQVLEENQIRRVPVVDDAGKVCGIVSLADIAERASRADSGEVLQQVVPDKVAAAIEEHKLHPLAEPHMHLVDAENIKVNGTEPVKLHVHVEVMPEIPSPNYDGMELVRRVKPVEDGEVEDLIARAIDQSPKPIEGPRKLIIKSISPKQRPRR